MTVDTIGGEDICGAAEARRVLIVSPYFPSSMLAGVHRARHLAKHLPSHGWWPIVIRVDEAHYTERPDPTLAALVPDSVEQVRTAALPARLLRFAGIGDIGLRGYVPIKRAIAKVASIRRPDAILITGSPFYPMLLSAWIKQHLNIPVVLDFQDPWVSTHGKTLQKWSKGGMVHRLAVIFEPRAVSHADFITSVSARQNDDLAARYAWIDRCRMAAIPIGGDPDDFKGGPVGTGSDSEVRLDSGQINLSYVGTFWPRAAPTVRTLLQSAAALRKSHPKLAARLRLNFVGTSGHPNHYDAYRIRPIAEEEGVADLVFETPQRVPFLQALHIIGNSQGLLLLGSDEPHYTASKLYPALMSGRPYVSLFHRASSAHSILSQAGGGKALAFEAPEDLASMVTPLSDVLRTLALDPKSFGKIDPAAYAPYTASAVARQFAAIFDRLALSDN